MSRDQLTAIAQYRRVRESPWREEVVASPPNGLTEVHCRWQSVIDYCREHRSEDCRHILRIMGESVQPS